MYISMRRLTVVGDDARDLVNDNVSLALVERLKARIARRESRRKLVPFETMMSEEIGPQLLPAA